MSVEAPTKTTAPKEKTYSRRAAAPEAVQMPVITADDVKAMIDADIQSRLQAALEQVTIERAEPGMWWDVFTFGPYQNIQPNAPLVPNAVIKAGETAYIGATIILNPFPILPPLPAGVSPASVLSSFALPFEVRFQTGNLTTWALGAPNLQAVMPGSFVPNVTAYTSVLSFVAHETGLFETNITARILGATPPYVNAPHFAGYSTWVYSYDFDYLDIFLGGGSGFSHNPCRYQVYP